MQVVNIMQQGLFQCPDEIRQQLVFQVMILSDLAENYTKKWCIIQIDLPEEVCILGVQEAYQNVYPNLWKRRLRDDNAGKHKQSTFSSQIMCLNRKTNKNHCLAYLLFSISHTLSPPRYVEKREYEHVVLLICLQKCLCTKAFFRELTRHAIDSPSLITLGWKDVKFKHELVIQLHLIPDRLMQEL